MYQPKVNNTQKYQDNQGSHVVTTGKLVIIKSKEMDSVANRNDVVTGINRKPIIISETEEIEKGDKFIKWKWEDAKPYIYTAEDSNRSLWDKENRGYDSDELRSYKAKKILALPENFSDKHLRAIVDCKMKEGKVLVKCGNCTIERNKGNRYNDVTYQVHLDQQNHITLFPAKESLEEFIREWMSNNAPMDFPKEDFTYQAMKATAEWAKKNNY